jgi:ATP-binding cassette subfamily C protein LapB
MDEQTEHRCLNLLRETIKAEDTLVLVTHKPILLSMVNRLIVVKGHQIIIDGPRDTVIEKLKENAIHARQVGQQNQPTPPASV